MSEKKYMIIEPAFVSKISVADFYLNRDKHYYTLPTQRSYVWKNDKQSKFIQSLILRYPIGVLTAHEGGEDTLWFMDGQQRGYTIIRFYDGKIRLDDDLENIVMKNPRTGELKEFELAGKAYLDLDEECRYLLDTRIIDIEKFRNLSDEQINEQILRLNSGQMLTSIERTRMIAHGDVQDFVESIVATDLFERKINVTESEKEKKVHNTMIYRLFMYIIGLEETKGVSLDDLPKLGAYIKDNNLLTNDIKNDVSEVIGYLDDTFPSRHPILSKNNFIPVYLVTEEAMNSGIEPRDFYKFICDFYDNVGFKDIRKQTKHNSVMKVIYKEKYKILKNHYDKAFKKKESTKEETKTEENTDITTEVK